MFWKRIIIGDQERVLVMKDGRFDAILEPGAYTVFVKPFQALGVERYNVRDLVFQSNWADFLVKERPAIVERFFTKVETSDDEVAIIHVDRKLYKVLPPGKRLLFWRGAEVTAKVINVVESPELPETSLTALERLGRESLVTFSIVDDARIGLLFIDNQLARTLKPGKYGFWSVRGSPRVEVVDLRRQALEVPGQEILTKDKVSIRVNILAEFQVTDAVKAKQVVKDSSEHLYRALQLSVRETLGKKTLEEVLADETDVDEAVVALVRAEMENIGVRVGDIALKDIILPGEMREILNQVVTAE